MWVECDYQSVKEVYSVCGYLIDLHNDAFMDVWEKLKQSLYIQRGWILTK